MKKYLLIILAIFQITKTIAQNTEENSPNRGQDPCARPQIITNPFNPQNTEWYSQRNRFNWMDYVTLHNSGKMRIPYFDNNNLYGNGQNSLYYFNNPFFDDDEIYLKHINLFSNTTNLKNQLVVDNDFSNFHRLVDEMDITSVEHGWELLWKFDGFEADGITPVSGLAGSDFKSMNFILYNRYTGMLRWFTAPRVNNTTFNELEPVIEFKDNRVASLFRNYNGLDQALDKTTEVVRIASPAKTSYNLPYFSMADFNISYDPCVCYFDSKLRYSLNANTTASIDIYGRLEGTSQMLSANDAINSDRLLSVFKNSDNNFRDQVKNGLLEYKNYGKMVDDFKKLDNKANIFDDAYSASKDISEIAQWGIDVADVGLKTILTFKKPWKSLKAFSKFTGFASMPFKSDKKTKSPPMLIQAQMSLTGQLNSRKLLNGFSFDMHTPGSFNTSPVLSMLNSPTNPDRFEYPVYNQALGLYALLKTPKKYVATEVLKEAVVTGYSVTKFNDGAIIPTYIDVDSVSSTVSYAPRIAYKLIEPPSFTLNPSAQINFNATTMEAAWMIEVENVSNAFWQFSSANMKPTYTYVNDNNKLITVYTSEFYPLECISNFVPIFDYELYSYAYRLEYKLPSPFADDARINLEKLFNLDRQRINNNKPRIVNAFLKINVLYRYNKPDGSGLNDIVNFETYKYEIEGNTNNQGLLIDAGVLGFLSEDELTLENIFFDSDSIVFAWDEINIIGNIDVLPGKKITIRAGKKINIHPEAIIHPDIVIEIGNPILCTSSRIQPTVIDESFCRNSSKYKANRTLAKTSFIDRTIQNELEHEESLQVGFFPNPASHNVTIGFPIESNYQVQLLDITGRTVFQTTFENARFGAIDISRLQSGTYFVQVIGNNKTSTQKIIVSH